MNKARRFWTAVLYLIVFTSLLFYTVMQVKAGEKTVDSSTFCTTENFINDGIDDDTLVFARNFTQKCLVNASPDVTVQLHINSNGGKAVIGAAIYDLLTEKKRGRHLTTVVMGQGSSAASLIFLAGDERVMSCRSFLLIHEARMVLLNQEYRATQLRQRLDELVLINNVYVDTYAKVTGLETTTILELMRRNTILSAKEALSLNFATKIIGDCGK